MENTPAEQPIVSTPVSTSGNVVPTPAVEAPVTTPAAPIAEVVKPSVETPKQIEPLADNVLGDVVPEPEVKKTEPALDAKVSESKVSEKTEVKPEGETKPTDGKPAEAPILPVYEFKLPENLNLDKAPIEAFTKILGEVETGKLDHAGYQEVGQKLLDLATQATQDSISKLNDYYVDFHKKQGQEWFDAFKKDPELAGSNLEETITSLRDVVKTYAGNESQTNEFRQLMKETNVGKHPALIRLIKNMDATIRKYETEGDANRIVPAARPAPSKVKDYQKFYQGS